MHPILNVAMQAVRKAGSIIIKNYEIINIIKQDKKDISKFITKLNATTERTIIKLINNFYPKHTISSKDNRDYKNSDIIQWLIEPMHGTVNFIKQLPYFAVSIAVRIKGYTEVAVIYNPILNELFSAVRGQGAQLNGYRLRSRNNHNLDTVILAANSMFRKQQKIPLYIKIFGRMFTENFDIRITGSTALNLAYVAAGRFNGCFDTNLQISDFVAGELIAKEAGALVHDFSGNHDYSLTGNIIAGNPKLVKLILNTLA